MMPRASQKTLRLIVVELPVWRRVKLRSQILVQPTRSQAGKTTAISVQFTEKFAPLPIIGGVSKASLKPPITSLYYGIEGFKGGILNCERLKPLGQLLNKIPVRSRRLHPVYIKFLDATTTDWNFYPSVIRGICLWA